MSGTCTYAGRTWTIQTGESWPSDLQEALPRVFGPDRSGLCLFEDRSCGRRNVAHLCGAAFFPGRRPQPPYWWALSLWSEAVPIIPPQQLHLWDSPRKLWRTIGSGILRDKRQWWGAIYHCQQGADWAAQNEIQQGAARVHQIRVSIKPGCKRKLVSREVPGCFR